MMGMRKFLTVGYTVTDKKNATPLKFRVFYKYHFNDYEFSNYFAVGVV
jgi:hypothetical protein